MSKDPEDEEERAKRESLESREERQEFYSDSHRRLSNQEIQVFSGGGGTLLNRAMFSHFDIDEDLADEEKQKRLNERVNAGPLDDGDRKKLYEAVRGKVEGALKSGNLQDVDPEPHPTDENSVSYKVGEHSLDQTELDGGMFKFSPGGKFTGVLRVERRGSDGELLPDSADIIEYKDGKPVSVIPGPEGETRVADFGLISREAGISVSRAKETGVSVSKAKDEKKEMSPSISDSHAPDPDALLKAGPLVKREAGGQKFNFKLAMGAFKEDIFPKLSKEHQMASNVIFQSFSRKAPGKGEIVPVSPGKVDKPQSKEWTPEEPEAVNAMMTIASIVVGMQRKGKTAYSAADIQKVGDAIDKVEGVRKRVSGLEDRLFGGSSKASHSNVAPAKTPKVKGRGGGEGLGH